MKKTTNVFPIPNTKIYKCNNCILNAAKMFSPDDPPCSDCGKPWYYCACCINCWRLTAVHLIKAIAPSVDVDEYKETLTECIKTLAKRNTIRFKPEDFDSMVDRVMQGRMN